MIEWTADSSACYAAGLERDENYSVLIFYSNYEASSFIFKIYLNTQRISTKFTWHYFPRIQYVCAPPLPLTIMPKHPTMQLDGSSFRIISRLLWKELFLVCTIPANKRRFPNHTRKSSHLRLGELEVQEWLWALRSNPAHAKVEES